MHLKGRANSVFTQCSLVYTSIVYELDYCELVPRAWSSEEQQPIEYFRTSKDEGAVISLPWPIGLSLWGNSNLEPSIKKHNLLELSIFRGSFLRLSISSCCWDPSSCPGFCPFQSLEVFSFSFSSLNYAQLTWEKTKVFLFASISLLWILFLATSGS